MNRNVFLLMICAVACIACSKDCPAVLELGTEFLEVPAEGGTYTLDIRSNTLTVMSVAYEDDTDWIYILPSSLRSDGVIELRISEYDYVLKDRSATVTVTAGDVSKTIRIIQLAKTGIGFGQESIIALDEGGEYHLMISSSCDWIAMIDTEAQSWVSLDRTSGVQGETEVIVKVSPLQEPDQRRETAITVNSGGRVVALPVMQGYAVRIGDILWAKCDVGEPNTFTSAPNVRGKLYQYDSKTAYESIFDDMTCPQGFNTQPYDGGTVLWQEVNNPCPTGWRVPTFVEAEALLGSMSNRRAQWSSWAGVPGVFAGNEDAVTATAEDTKGCIFIPENCRRYYRTGYADWSHSAFIQTVTRPSHNWGRRCPYVHENNEIIYTYEAENPDAIAVRCVASLPE